MSSDCYLLGQASAAGGARDPQPIWRGGNQVATGGASLFTNGFNLEGPNPGVAPPSCMLTRLTDQTGVDPMLGPMLGSNGGPTMTRSLLPGSPAIDMGRSFGETTDQRDFTRPVVFPGLSKAPGGDGSDIGAFELAQACDGQSTPTTSCTPPAPPSTGAATPTATGQRAAALKKCKKQRRKRKKKGKPYKKYKKQYKQCKKKANKLPV